jgi:hypothetical protein
LTGKRDWQRTRVYAWENRVVAPRDPTFVKFREAQAMVDAIWSDMDLLYPPAVEPLARQASTTVASADRLSIFLPARTPSWLLLHEIAHAMTSDADGSSDGHGEVFMGLYVQLLVRYLRLDQSKLLASLQDDGIAIAVDARPVFINA